ncbi:MAG: hypothetical protein EDR02_10360 [Actinobacteria bacterium]|nr:MAG: hypothetical protein EDR02_10360 [Actinomycetota bacterium]RIK04985.1 MAG: hypothetical protein DCC48_11580 [Acidobacteriota bacterium]
MGQLLGRVLPLAFMAAVSPTIFLATVVLLTRSRPVFRAGIFTIGTAIPLLAIGVLVGVAFRSMTLDSKSTLSASIDVAAGTVLVLAAAFTALRPARPREDKPPSDPRPLLGFLGGVALMATNFSTLLPFTVAVKDIALSDAGQTAEITTFALAVVIVLIPAWVPLAMTVVVPSGSEVLLGRLRTFLDRYGKWFMVGVLGLIGIYLLVRGLPALI